MGQKFFMGQKKVGFFKKLKKCHFLCEKKWAFVPFLSRILSHKKLEKIAKIA